MGLESPRIRRLGSDWRALQRLQEESTIFSFRVQSQFRDEPPNVYLLSFRGQGLYRHEGSREVFYHEEHQVLIQLSAGYPRQMPDLRWQTPIFHPNISASGIVCLGGFGTHWVPSLQLDTLCCMLWDMIRYKNFDVKSPFNREAAAWASAQQPDRFPLDTRPLRDRSLPASRNDQPAQRIIPSTLVTAEIVDDAPVRPLVVAELVEDDQPDIVFVDR